MQAFHQIDEGTGQILSVPTPVIGRNLQYFCDYFELSNAELNCLQNGEPLTLVDEGSMLTLGIDLHDPTGIRIGIGTEQEGVEKIQLRVLRLLGDGRTGQPGLCGGKGIQ